MNKAIRKSIFLLLPAVLLAACSPDNEPITVESGTPPHIIVTRTTEQGSSEFATVFREGTEVGVSVQGNSTFTNLKHEYRSGALKPTGEDILWSKGGMTVDAYYPYREDGNYAAPSVYEDQSTEKNYYLSDALHATGTVSRADNTLALLFDHLTAKVILTFTEDVDEVTIANQAVTQGGEATHTIKAYKETAQKWKAHILPQLNLTVNVKKGDKTYKAELELDYFDKCQYTYALELCIRARAKRGDYYYQDGTYSTTYTDNPSNPCIGIVCATQGDEIMQHLSKPGYTHGLVVSLYDAPQSGSGGHPTIGDYADTHSAPASGTSGWYTGSWAELAWLFSGIYHSSFADNQFCGNSLQRILDPAIQTANGDKLADKEYVFGGYIGGYYCTIENGTIIGQWQNVQQPNRAFLAY